MRASVFDLSQSLSADKEHQHGQISTSQISASDVAEGSDQRVHYDGAESNSVAE